MASFCRSHQLTLSICQNFDLDSEDDKVPDGVKTDLSSTVPTGTDKTPEMLDSTLASLPPKWRNWVIRGIFTWLMIGGFGLIIYAGPLALMIIVC